ncbi:PREDICTED: fatty acid hydroxylase domain-containing protein 2-like [Amphimedon queenslandica]|uniref:Fatty acid hydroxylase domain-containing protein n=1 Tax=Amphimedon queenslandica TaxID=400682 RepID=A0A1X7URW3_AMPQE|nr:PREDICTED: fatty acid hydroxylase domain-containing protein 2-like [Amphimedon queenslandica]|eukprot:XP_003386944.1 PREDICTED: fatty acid hydroxylase domain-containing protein 2-like [Amphimedon queenslandica]
MKFCVAAPLEATKKGIFILSTALIVFVAISNSLQWHMEEFWGASKAFFVEKWAYIYYNFGYENFFVMYILGTSIYGLVVYTFINMLFGFVDVTGRPQIFKKYKIQDTKNFPVDPAKYKKCLQVVTFNSLLIGPLFLVVSSPIAYWRGLNCGYQLPTFPQVICQLIVFTVSVETGFYYMHRLFHHRSLYSRIHKIHHEWTAPISLASVYCHPIEHFCCNIFPIMLGPIILGTWFSNHLSAVWLWVAIAIVNTTFSHCGYHLPFLSSPEGHDFHHSKFNQNFGVLGILDRLHGTDNVFVNSIEHKRHFILLGLSSAKELVPDDKKMAMD